MLTRIKSVVVGLAICSLFSLACSKNQETDNSNTANQEGAADSTNDVQPKGDGNNASDGTATTPETVNTSQNWSKFADDEGRFEVEFPGTPKRSTAKSAKGKVITKFVFQDGPTEYLVDYTPLSSAKMLGFQMKEKMLDRIAGMQPRESIEKIKTSGLPAIEFETIRAGTRRIHRTCISGESMYEWWVTGPTAGYDESAAKRFLESFVLKGIPAAPDDPQLIGNLESMRAQVLLDGRQLMIGAGADVPKVLEMSKGLKGLTSLVSFEAVKDADLVHLKELKKLKSLELPGAGYTDAGLAHLTGVSSLESLDFSYSPVTDAGIAHLAGLTGLKTLDLKSTKVTDASIPRLSGLKNLTSLKVTNTQLTQAGIANLKKALPMCNIEAD